MEPLTEKLINDPPCGVVHPSVDGLPGLLADKVDFFGYIRVVPHNGGVIRVENFPRLRPNGIGNAHERIRAKAAFLAVGRAGQTSAVVPRVDIVRQLGPNELFVVI
jgi:hypothetical protein